MEKIQQIKELVEKFVINVDDGVRENIEVEYMDKYHRSGYTTYSAEEDVEKLMVDLGNILENQTLIDLFKKPRTIDEIVAELKEDTDLTSYEEMEEIEISRDAERENKYVYITTIYKHIPTSKFYSFTVQSSGDYYNKAEFDGEVVQQQVTTTQWVNK